MDRPNQHVVSVSFISSSLSNKSGQYYSALHKLVCIFLHTCCFFMSPNSFQVVSWNFIHNSALVWFQDSFNVWGSSLVGLVSSTPIAIVVKSIKKIKFLSLEQLAVSVCVLRAFVKYGVGASLVLSTKQSNYLLGTRSSEKFIEKNNEKK